MISLKKEKTIHKPFRLRRVVIFFIIIVIILSALFVSSILLAMKMVPNNLIIRERFNQLLVPAIQQRLEAFPNVFINLFHFLFKGDIDTVLIDIKFKEYDKLVVQRQNALERGMILIDDKNTVDATLTSDGKTIPIKIRLKGEYLDHISDPYKWSFRIETKNESSFNGMVDFSIQNPERRSWLSEWIFETVLKKLGLPALKVDYFNLILNGKDYGVYMFEESFNMILINSNNRREGPILKFEESYAFEEINKLGSPERQFSGYGYFYSAEVNSYNEKTIRNNDELFMLYKEGASQLNKFRERKAKASEVFDIDMMAKLIAISDILGAEHALAWNQFKFYYNPITNLFEPIASDADSGYETTRLRSSYSATDITEYDERAANLLLTLLFEDIDFFEKYVYYLDKYSTPGFLENLFDEMSPDLENMKIKLAFSYPLYVFSSRTYFENRDYVKTILNPTKVVTANLIENRGDKIKIEIANLQQIPAVLHSVVFNGSIYVSEYRTILPRRPLFSPAVFKEFVLKYNGSITNQSSFITSSLLGKESVIVDNIQDYPRISKYESIGSRSTGLSNVDLSIFVKDGDKLILRGGNYILSENLIVPRNYKVMVFGGTTITLQENASIISYSPLVFIGSDENPVRIIGAGEYNGVYINSLENSEISYTHFINLSTIKQDYWSLTGGLNCYESNLVIKNSILSGARAEDGINVIRSNFSLVDSSILGTYSDGLDSDFSNGKIQNVKVFGTGNDGVDTSGSSVMLHNVEFKDIGDKAVSAGEDSIVQISHIIIDRANLGIVSKDLSEVNAAIVEIRNTNIGVLAFQKKPEFGGSKMVIKGVTISNVTENYLLEDESEIIWDGEYLSINSKKLRDRFY